MTVHGPRPVVQLLTRQGCHLCADARAVLDEAGAAWSEIDVDTDPELRAEWGDMVPVLLVDGVCHGYYHLDPVKVATLLR